MKKTKKRKSLEEILHSTSLTLFPEGDGEKEVGIDSRDVDGETPLHVLVGRDDNHGSILLIDAGADVNAIGDLGRAPLHTAAAHGNITLIRALIDAGARLTVRDEFGQTPLDLAEGSDKEVIKALRREPDRKPWDQPHSKE